MADTLPPMERNIVEAMDGYDEAETAALIAKERTFAGRLAAGEADSEQLRAEITGSERDPHWWAAWESARHRIAPCRARRAAEVH